MLVPLGVHPAELGGLMGETTAWVRWKLPLEVGAAWDRIWHEGRGRRPWEGGTAAAFEHCYNLGIRFEQIRIGETEHWVPREATADELDSRDQYKGMCPYERRMICVPEETRAWERWEAAQLAKAEAAAVAPPRRLSPAEPGRMEERGWMTWGAGKDIAVSDN